MILLLSSSPDTPAHHEPASGPAVSRRTPSDMDEVLGWVADEGIEGVVIHWPTPGFNAFALARRLQAAGGPRVVMTGDMRPETRFWAERNGCQLAADPTEALNQWGAS